MGAVRVVAERLEDRTLLSTTWYVSTAGSNANSGKLTSPFQTIQHAADMAHAGDTVDIMGGVYHETVTVHNSGSASAGRITFQPYNSQPVTIDGADPVSGWTNTSGNVYTAPMSWDLGEGNNQVFVDNKLVGEARWPAAGLSLSNPTLATVQSATVVGTTVGPATATIKDTAITQGSGFWVGGSIRIGAGSDWVNQTGTITASGTGFVTFTFNLDDPRWQVPTTGNQYYLFGVSAALNAPGEWFDTGGNLSLWTSGSDSPSSHLVEARNRQFGFDVSSASYIRIQGINLFACSINTGPNSIGVLINHITADYLQQFAVSSTGFSPPQAGGIILRGSNDALTNSVIANTAGDGVYVAGPFDTVSNNLIHDVDYSGVDAAGIRVGAWYDTISHNTIYNSGRHGILFSGAKATITYNTISAYGLQTSDVGGFYSYGFNGQSTVIAFNRISAQHDANFGTVGIFIDGGGSGFLIHHNIVWNVDTALCLNGNLHNIQFYNNTLDAITWAIDKDGFVDDWTGVVLENNILTHPIQFGSNVQLIDNISNHMQFVNYAAGNFMLLPTAPAVDTGMLIPPYTNGYVGTAPDVGAGTRPSRLHQRRVVALFRPIHPREKFLEAQPFCLCPVQTGSSAAIRPSAGRHKLFANQFFPFNLCKPLHNCAFIRQPCRSTMITSRLKETT